MSAVAPSSKRSAKPFLKHILFWIAWILIKKKHLVKDKKKCLIYFWHNCCFKVDPNHLVKLELLFLKKISLLGRTANMDSMWIQWERICLLVVNGNDNDGCNHANHNCNCGRYDPIPTGHHSDCQLKQVIGHIWTGPTSRRQYVAFWKIELLFKT